MGWFENQRWCDVHPNRLSAITTVEDVDLCDTCGVWYMKNVDRETREKGFANRYQLLGLIQRNVPIDNAGKSGILGLHQPTEKETVTMKTLEEALRALHDKGVCTFQAVTNQRDGGVLIILTPLNRSPMNGARIQLRVEGDDVEVQETGADAISNVVEDEPIEEEQTGPTVVATDAEEPSTSPEGEDEATDDSDTDGETLSETAYREANEEAE